MQVLSRRTYMDTGQSIPRLFMTAQQLSKYEGMTPARYQQIFREISAWIDNGRYPETAMSDSKPHSVNYYVYRDYMANRSKLRNRNLRKTVKPFNPAEIAAICPMVREVVVMGE